MAYFSVIVPIYKVEPYLRRCAGSILAQTFRDFELILVDDGSPDGCPAICDGYAARDGRVRVIHKPNGGLVSARQAGMEIAAGEYVVNVDGDDWIAPGFLERAFCLAQEHNADIISFAITHVEKGRARTAYEPVPEGVYTGERKRRELEPRMLMPPNMDHLFYYLCGKAIRRSLIYAHQMAVSRKISLGEDVACLMPVYFQAERVYICRTPMYFYRARPDSDSRMFRPEQYSQLLEGLKALEGMGGPPEFAGQVSRYAAFALFALLNGLLASGQYRHLSLAQRYMARPELRVHLRAARFRGITPKMRITYFLFRRGWTGAAAAFLRLCIWVKRGLGPCR